MSWQQSTLGEECELYQPQTLAKNELDNSGLYKVYGANGVIGTHSKYNHDEPQLLITCRGATCGTINISESKSWINGNAMVVKPIRKNIDLYFLSHYLHYLDISKAITGAAQPQITRQSLSPIKIQFPPLADQKRIAAILDKAAEIKAKREQAIAKLDELTQSIFVEMFGNVVANDKGWNVATIGDSPIFIADGNYSSKYPTAAEFVESGVPFIRANNLKQLTVIEKDLRFISPEKHKELAKGHLKHRDVLVITRGEIGKVGLVPKNFEDANINAQLVLMRCTNNQLQPEYLCHLFNNRAFSKYIENFQTGAALKQLPVGNLKKIKIPLPSVSMQETFAKFIEAIEVQTTAMRDSNLVTDNLIESLQQRAFTMGFD
jgi:type I restriction enzyme S subunit